MIRRVAIRKGLEINPKDTKTIVKEYGLTSPFERFFDIAKIDEEKRIVFGIMTKASLDNQDEIVEWEATKEAVRDFMKWGNVREMHREDSAAGVVKELEIDDENKLVKIRVKIVDDDAWKKVKEGVYKGFSIGGKALKRVKEFVADLGKVVSKVKKYILNEVSLVDRPAHPECVFVIAKREGHYNDPLSSEISTMRRKLGIFESRIMTDSEINKLRDKEFGLVRKIRSRDGIIVKKRYFAMPDKVHAQAVLNVLKGSDLRPKDKFLVHKRAERILGKSHNGHRCWYCQQIAKIKQFHQEDPELAKVRRKLSKLDHARMLLDEAEAEDFEAAMKPAPGVESENLRPARMRRNIDSSMSEYEGPVETLEGDFDEGEQPPPGYEFVPDEEMEGEEFEPYYEDDEEDYEGVPEEAGTWAGYEGFSEGAPTDTTRTHTLDPEALVAARKKPLDREDQEGEYWDPEEEGYYPEEEEEGGQECPYCGTTIRLAMQSGAMRKGGSAQCPGCGQIYDLTNAPVTSVSARDIQKGSALPDDEIDAVAVELAKRDEAIAERDEIIEKMIARVEALEGKAPPRKGRIIRKIDRGTELGEEDTQLTKAEVAVKDNMQKAMQLREMQKTSGKPLSPEQEAFCQTAAQASLDLKTK